MQSISKTPLSQDALRAIVAHHFGSATRLLSAEELTDGFFNAAYRLDLTNGFRYVLKAAPPASIRVLRYEQDIMAAEVEAIRLVRANTSMPAPKIYCYDRSRALIENEFFIMAFIPGESLFTLKPRLAPEDLQPIERQVGAYLREMNTITGRSFGYCAPSSPQFGSWREAFDFMVRGVLADGQEIAVDLPLPYDALQKLLEHSYAALEEVATPQLVHWDLWDGNIFVDPDTRKITGVIDFERALWGDPLMEVNFGAFKPLTSDSPFLAGYGQPMLETTAEQTRRILYNIYLFLIMIIECYYRHYPTKQQENWAREQLSAQLHKLTV